MGSLRFFSYLILPASLCLWGRLNVWQKWAPGLSPVGVKAARCISLIILPPSCADWLEIQGASNSWSPKSLFFFFFFHWHCSPLWALACRTMPFHFFLSTTNSPSSHSQHFLLPLSIFSWVFPFYSCLPFLEWRSSWASYPPPFSLGDLTSLSCALLSILLYFLLSSSLLVLDSSDFSIPRFHI